MSFRIISVDNTAEGKHGIGVKMYMCEIDEQADLAQGQSLDCAYAVDNAMNTYKKSPATGNWVLPAATPILIITQPEDVNTTVGEIAESLSVVASAQDSTQAYTPTYQWYSCEDTSKTNPSAVSGETAAIMALDTELSADTYYYYCTVTANGKTLDTDVATVVVDASE